MYKKNKICALIFLREESTRIPGKNLRIFNKKPLFHSILSTLEQSKYLDQIVVNTPSDKIIADCSDFKVKIHKRPEWLNKVDRNEANEIIKFDLEKLDYEFYLQTHSTNPLLKIETIDKSIETFFNNIGNYDSLFSVNSFKKRFYTYNGKAINHDIEKLLPTQKIQPILMENSCIYIFSKKSFFMNENRIGKTPFLFETDINESVDIDYEEDFKLAEKML